VHWVLDVAFREDDCRARIKHSAENFAVLTHRAEPASQRLRPEAQDQHLYRHLRGAWRPEFLLRVLGIHPRD
jgi:hypothetical protein